MLIATDASSAQLDSSALICSRPSSWEVSFCLLFSGFRVPLCAQLSGLNVKWTVWASMNTKLRSTASPVCPCVCVCFPFFAAATRTSAELQQKSRRPARFFSDHTCSHLTSKCRQRCYTVSFGTSAAPKQALLLPRRMTTQPYFADPEAGVKEVRSSVFTTT